MKKSFLIIIGIGLAMIFGIFLLPKGNVSNKTAAEAGTANRDAAGASVKEERTADENQHIAPLSESLQREITQWKNSFESKKDLGSLTKLIEAFREGNRICVLNMFRVARCLNSPAC